MSFVQLANIEKFIIIQNGQEYPIIVDRNIFEYQGKANTGSQSTMLSGGFMRGGEITSTARMITLGIANAIENIKPTDFLNEFSQHDGFVIYGFKTNGNPIKVQAQGVNRNGAFKIDLGQASGIANNVTFEFANYQIID